MWMMKMMRAPLRALIPETRMYAMLQVVSHRCNTSLQDAEAEAEKAAIARRERERLRLQDKVKRDNLDKLRAQQNQEAADGEVRLLDDDANPSTPCTRKTAARSACSFCFAKQRCFSTLPPTSPTRRKSV